MTGKPFTLLAILLLCAPAAVFSADINVPDDYETIQEAIDEAEDGDTIFVEADVYVENLEILGKSITLESIDGPEETIIDGVDQTLGEEYGAVINLIEDEFDEDDSGVSIVGFTLMNGAGTDHEVPSGATFSFGAGLYVLNRAITIENCILEDNEADAGGSAFFISEGAAILSDCIIRDNDTGGIRARSADLTVTECEILSNDGIGFWSIGGSVLISDSFIEALINW